MKNPNAVQLGKRGGAASGKIWTPAKLAAVKKNLAAARKAKRRTIRARKTGVGHAR